MDSIPFHVNVDRPEESLADLVAGNESATYEYALPYDEITSLSNALEQDKPLNVVSEVQQFKTAK